MFNNWATAWDEYQEMKIEVWNIDSMKHADSKGGIRSTMFDFTSAFHYLWFVSVDAILYNKHPLGLSNTTF
jgi:hypothetical protein